jgi:tripartite-type tricarboxylate transporter receptor subunit TctC
MKRILTAVVAAVTLGVCVSSAPAQQAFPTRPITMIVPFRAGGPTDTVGRTLSAAMGRFLQQPVQVQIVDGAGGTIGAQRVAEAAPDGYTILLYHVGMATTPTLYPNLPYNPLTDFAEIGLATEVAMTLVTRQRLPVATWPQLRDYIAGHLDTFTMAHAGIGSASHLCAQLFKMVTGLDVTTIPFLGTAEAMLDLQADFVDMMCDQTTSTVASIQDGRVIPYVVTSPTRLDQIDNVPTYLEVGLDGFELSVWHGLWAPAGTPPEVIARLTQALQAALRDPQVLRTFALFATEPSPVADQTPEALRAKVEAEIEHWRPMLLAAGEFVQ